MAKNYYQILGVSKDAPYEEIKKAYRKLAHRYHPDKGGDERKFKEINEAYQILGNKEKRSQYDKFGRAFDDRGFDPGFDFGFGPGFDSSSFGNVDLGEIIEEMFGFGHGRRKKDLKKGKDLEVEIEIPLESILRRQEKEISLYKMILCSRCQGGGAEPGTSTNECFSCRGVGEVQQIKKTFFGSFTKYAVCPECGGEGYRPEKPCNVCKGEGRVKGEDKIKIFIPAGVDTNQMIKIEGRGEAGRKGGESGDLYIRIFVKKHLIFQRRGDDLYAKVTISFSRAVLGGEIEVLTVEGKKILLKVPSGIESGKVLRISGKGIPRFSGFGTGNMYIELVVEIPKKPSKKQKELLEKLREEGM